ncbi:MAG TPA: hypothetical protein VJS92_13095, partial [Candidatus Polarisedimenticolaceae bacterium]|nr:hypothetical protein [Candidatus Polarisedimenticolaceae bacterium]
MSPLEATLDPLELEDYLLLAPVVLLPWVFGGVELPAYRTAALLLVAAAALCWVRGGGAGLKLDRGSAWLVPAALLGLWALVQVMPLPPALIQRLSPRADAVYRTTFPGYPGAAPGDVLAAFETRALAAVPEAAEIAEPTRETPSAEPGPVPGRWHGWRTLSLWPSAGVERLYWYAALLLGFLAVRARAADAAREQLYRSALFATFLGLALFGLLYAASANGRLYWVRPLLSTERPFGPYVNPTNFAGVMELAVPWLGGAAADALRRAG